MKKKTVVGIALAVGMLSMGAVSASTAAASSCCNGSKCADRQAIEGFDREATETTDTLKAKELELRELYGYDGIDANKVAELQSEIQGLRANIKVVAGRYDILSCCLN